MKKQTAFALMVIALLIVVAAVYARPINGGDPDAYPAETATAMAPTWTPAPYPIVPATAVPATAAPPAPDKPRPGTTPEQLPDSSPGGPVE